MITMDSEFQTSSTSYSGYPAQGIFNDKHMQTIIRMIDTVLFFTGDAKNLKKFYSDKNDDKVDLASNASFTGY